MPLADVVKRGTDAKVGRWNILLFGFPGSGKTTLAAQAPDPLIIELDENGWIVLNHPLVRENARYIAIRSFEKAVKFVEQLKKDPLLQDIRTVVLDTVSEAQTLERLAQLPPDAIRQPWKFNEHIYAVNNFKVLLLVKEILALNKNTILNCHMVEDTIGEGSTKKIIIRPALSPTLLTNILALLDGTFFLAKENNTRKLLLQSTADIVTKSRFQKNGTIYDPTFDKLLPILEEYKSND